MTYTYMERRGGQEHVLPSSSWKPSHSSVPSRARASPACQRPVVQNPVPSYPAPHLRGQELVDFLQEPDSKYFRLCRPCGLCHNLSLPPQPSSHEQYINEQAWLHSSKTSLTETGPLPDLGIWPVGYCLLTSDLDLQNLLVLFDLFLAP